MVEQKFNRLVAFSRVPKTGSSSIVDGLEDIGITIRGNPVLSKKAIWVVNGNQVNRVGAPGIEEHYCFATIRNPLTRFLSGWRFCLKMEWLGPDCTPIDLLEMVKKDDRNTMPYMVYYHVAKAQCRWLFSDGKFICNNIIKYENLVPDTLQIMKILGISNFQMGHKKNSRDDNSLTPGTNEFYLLKYPELKWMHRQVFEEDWRRLSYD